MSRRFQQTLVGSNLKMYKTNQQTLDYLLELQHLTADIPSTDLRLFILPSYTALADACRAANHHRLWIGAQNMHWAEQGPYTGEISPLMLQELKVDLVMAGHAERRQLFGETDAMVNRRVLSSLAHGFQTLVCVGDTASDVQRGASGEVLRRQLHLALNGVSGQMLPRLWVAYEPVWAIGDQGQVAEPAFANAMHLLLRQVLEVCFPGQGETVPLLYGGSVNTANLAELIAQPEIDGLFIGRAAWEAARFNQMIRQALAHRQIAAG